MKERILEIIKTKPKHFTRLIKKDAELDAWVISNSTIDADSPYIEHIYSALNPTTNPICENGNKKKFKSIFDGYGYCGHASKCECAQRTISKKCSIAITSKSKEEIDKITAKRRKTNMEKYGVINAAQAEHARKKHKEFYEDKNKVAEAVIKNKATKLARYGSETYNNRIKATKTTNEHYGVSNPMQRPDIVQKALSTKAERYDPYHIAKANHATFVQSIIDNFGVFPHISKDEYIGVASRPVIDFKCVTCGHTFTKRFDYANPPICKVCHPSTISYKSAEELEIYEFCKELTNGVISGDRTLINPYEVDIYIPDKKVAIEYCGLYWHSELSSGKSWSYHYKKYQKLKDLGIQLITIYSDEWINKKDVVKSLLRSKLGSETNVIYARNTEVRMVDRKEAYNFIECHHLQDAPKQLPLNYGLYNNDILVALMTFKKHKQGYELTRFCTAGRIVGGASKLLSAFVKEHNNTSVVSFSNNRYSDGNLYKILGFEVNGIVPPMQEYVIKYSKRIHKRGIKKIISEWNNAITEWENAKANNIDRIWDCGKIKWIKQV